MLMQACNEPTIIPEFTGRWDAEAFTIQIYSEDDLVSEDIITQPDTYLNFNDNGTVTVHRNGLVSSGTYQQQDNELVTTIDIHPEPVIIGGTFTITEHTATTLRLHQVKEINWLTPDQGEVPATLQATVHFRRSI
jgi:hypothetical protein